jgi:hypothetical protein
MTLAFYTHRLALIHTGACPTLPFVTRRRRSARCEAADPEKPEAYSLEYVEDFFGPSTTQMAADCSPQ